MTSASKATAKRWYDDACGTALAMELVGERWSLLIVRELMFGPRRFSELRAGLPGISANVLTQRLTSMEVAGILTRRMLQPPANAQVYELTPWGLEAEDAISELGRWAAKSPDHDPSLPLSPASMMMSLRTMIDRGKAALLNLSVAFRFGREVFVGRLADGELTITRGEQGDADLRFEGDPHGLAALVYGRAPLAELEAAGALKFAGDRALAERFADLFGLPEKWSRVPTGGE